MDISGLSYYEEEIGATDVFVFAACPMNKKSRRWKVMGDLILQDMKGYDGPVRFHYFSRYSTRKASPESLADEVKRGAAGAKISLLFDDDLERNGYRSYGEYREDYMNGLIQECADLGIPVLFHTSTMSRPHHPNNEILDMVRNTTGGKFIIGHSGMFDVRKVDFDAFLETGKAYFETSIMDLDDKCEVLRRTGGDNVVFGSDCPYRFPVQEAMLLLEAIKKTGLEKRKGDIFYGNARRIIPETIQYKC